MTADAEDRSAWPRNGQVIRPGLAPTTRRATIAP